MFQYVGRIRFEILHFESEQFFGILVVDATELPYKMKEVAKKQGQPTKSEEDIEYLQASNASSVNYVEICTGACQRNIFVPETSLLSAISYRNIIS